MKIKFKSRPLKKGGFFWGLAITTFILLGFTLQTQPVYAQPTVQTGVQTKLSISGKRTFMVGEPIRIHARLTTQKGQPLAGQEITFYLDGNYQQQQDTDAAGVAVFSVPNALPAGRYPIKMDYSGPYEPDTTERELVVEPAEIQVETVPPLPGVPFSFEGQIIHSGEDGIARILINQTGVYQISLLPFEGSRSDSQVIFTRWEPESFELTRTITVPGVNRLQAGFEVRYPVRFIFIDTNGEVVHPDRIATFIARGSNGIQYDLESSQAQWLQANTLFRRLSGLDSVTVIYSIQRVMVDGSNVVNRGQQRFSVSSSEEIEIKLLLFSAVFSAADSLFQFPVGSGVTLIYPDENAVYFPFDEHGTVALERLARGTYLARITDLSGFSIPVPVVISRDQVITLPAISYLDVIVLFLVTILIILIFLLFRRRNLEKTLKEQTFHRPINPSRRYQ